jgi:glycosyltransferase involved in cell wall biosynthesis
MISPWNVRCGIFTYTRSLAEALAKLGVEVYVVRWPRFGARTPELVESMVLEKIPVDKVDLIHVQHEYGLFTPNLEGGFYSYLKRLGKPVVTTMHAVGSVTVDRVVGEVSSRVVVHNEHCFKHFLGDRSKAVIIPHGCEPKETPPTEECKRALGVDPRIPIVGYVGYISPAKGVEQLIEAVAKVPEAALLIGGGWFIGEETDYINQLKRWSLQLLPGRCQWLGYVPEERLPTVYGAMDLLVYPSLYASESGALLLGLSYGKPALASNLPPFREKEKLGALMVFEDVDDLRVKIKAVLEDSGLRLKLSEGAKRYCEENRWYPNVAEKHISLYEAVLKEEKR